MDFNPRLSLRTLLTLAIALLSYVAPARAAEEPAAAAHPPEYTEEQKALLKALDAEIVRFDAMLARDDDAQHAAMEKGFLDGLKQRRDAMNKIAFEQSRYDELRYDLNVYYQRLALWFAAPVAPPPAANHAATADVLVYMLNPSPAVEADVNAALAALDREIERLDHLASTPEAKAKMKRVKDRRADLRLGFTRAKWDAVLAELKQP